MPAQSFFYETSHSNFGMMFMGDFEDHIETVQAIQAKAKALDESNKDIYRVIAQFSSRDDGIQIFVAPYVRYDEIAEMVLDSFEACGKAYFKDKGNNQRQIRKKEFLSKLQKIIRFSNGNRGHEVAETVALIKWHFEKQAAKLDKAIERIALKYSLGVVKYQEYYVGLAETWIEDYSPKPKVA